MTLNSLLRRVQGKSLSAQLVRGTGLSFALIIAGTGLSFVLGLLLVRLMGPEAYGDFTYVTSWLAVLTVVGAAGYGMAATRFIADYIAREKWGELRGFLEHSYIIIGVVSSAVGLVLIAIALVMRGSISNDLFLAFIIGGIEVPINAYVLVLGKSLLSVKQVAASQAPMLVGRPLLLIGAAVLLRLLTPTPNAALMTFMDMLITLSVLVYSYALLRKVFRANIRDVQKVFLRGEWNAMSLQVLWGNILGQITYRIDIILVGIYLGTTKAGIYTTVNLLVRLLDFGYNAANNMLAPMISELYVQGQHRKLQRLLALAALGIAAYSVAIGIGLVALGRPLLELFDPSFSSGYLPLVIIVVGRTVNALCGSVSNLLLMTGHQREVTRIMFVTTVFTVVANMVLIPRLDMVGAAIAFAAGTILWNVWMHFRVKKLLNLDATILSAPSLREA